MTADVSDERPRRKYVSPRIHSTSTTDSVVLLQCTNRVFCGDVIPGCRECSAAGDTSGFTCPDRCGSEG